MHILSVEAISKDYGLRPVLENVSLGLDGDDRVGVVGVNGSGKTTFLRLVAGDERPDAGRIILADGVVTPVVTIDEESGELEGEPEVVARGLLGLDGNGNAANFMRDMRRVVT